MTELGTFCIGLTAWMAPGLALTVVSAILGVLLLIVFRYTSPQTALKGVGHRVRANMLAMKLYKDELRVTFGAQKNLFIESAKRFTFSLPPLVVMLPPMILALAQMSLWWQWRPLLPGEETVMIVRFTGDGWDKGHEMSLTLPDGVELSAPPVHVDLQRQVAYRLRATKAGHHVLKFNVGNRTIEKEFPVGKEFTKVSIKRPRASFWEQLLYPGEPTPHPTSGIESIEVKFPDRVNKLLWWDVHWIITFFILSLVFALIAKPFLKVNI